MSEHETWPAPPPLPSESEMAGATGGGAITPAEREEANWVMIRSSLAAMSQTISRIEEKVDAHGDTLDELKHSRGTFIARIDERLQRFDDFQHQFQSRSDTRWLALNERFGAFEALVIAFRDSTDAEFGSLNRVMNRMNEILAGVRHATDSALDVATTAARDIKEVRRSSIPGADDTERSLKAVPGGKPPGS